MRTFLMTVFWITNVGSVLQLLAIALASWLVLSSVHTFFEFDGHLLSQEYLPAFPWVRLMILAIWGELGDWMLAVPVLVIAPLQLVFGSLIGFWAYNAARGMPVHEPALPAVL